MNDKGIRACDAGILAFASTQVLELQNKCLLIDGFMYTELLKMIYFPGLFFSLHTQVKTVILMYFKHRARSLQLTSPHAGVSCGQSRGRRAGWILTPPVCHSASVLPLVLSAEGEKDESSISLL